MRLGINTYTFMWSIGFEGARPQRPMSAMQLLERATQLGVKVVQVGPNLPLDELRDYDLDAFCQRAQDDQIELELCTRGIKYDHLAAQVKLSKKVGAKLLRTLPDIDGRTPGHSEMVEHLRAILPVVEENGIRLAIENGKIPALDLAAAMEEVGNSSLGIVLDTANSLAVPEGWRDVAAVLAPYTMCLHLKEFIIKRAWHMMGFICEGRPAGKGQLDIPWLLETCRRSKHPYNVIIELWPPEQEHLQDTIDLEQAWAAESVDFMRQYIPE